MKRVENLDSTVVPLQETDFTNEPFTDAITILDSRATADSIDAIESALSLIKDDRKRQVTEMLVYSVDVAKNASKRQGKGTPRIIRFNHALRRVIKDDYPISSDNLITLLMLFARKRDIPPKVIEERNGKRYEVDTVSTNEARENIEEQFKIRFLGMWNEQAFENLLGTTGIMGKNASPEHDKTGKDFFVQPDPKVNSWVAVDIKSSANGLEETREKFKDRDYGAIKTISLQAFGGDASLKSPVISTMNDDRRFVVAVDYGIAGIPKNIRAPQEKYFDKTIAQLLTSKLCRLMEEENTIRYVEYDGDFITESRARQLGIIAISA